MAELKVVPLYPRIKRHFSLVAHSLDSVELRYGVWNPSSFMITDEMQSGHLFNLLSALDGSRSLEQLAIEEQVPLEQVEALFEHLQKHDLVETTVSTSLDYYLNEIIPTLARGKPAEETMLPVTVLGDRECAQAVAAQLRQGLPQSDIALVSESDPAWRILVEADSSWLTNGRLFYERLTLFESWQRRLLIFATSLIQPQRLQILNRVSLALNIPWLHATFDGPFLFVGPTFVPHRSACYECFESRVMINLRENAGYLRYKQALLERRCQQGTAPLEGVLSGLLAAHITLEALNYILTRSSFTLNKVLAIYLPTMEFTFNEVLRVPGCAGCGSSAPRDEEALYFDTRALIQHTRTVVSLEGALDHAAKNQLQ